MVFIPYAIFVFNMSTLDTGCKAFAVAFLTNIYYMKLVYLAFFSSIGYNGEQKPHNRGHYENNKQCDSVGVCWDRGDYFCEEILWGGGRC